MRFTASHLRFIACALSLTSLAGAGWYGCGEEKKPAPLPVAPAEPPIDRPVATAVVPAVLSGSVQIASPEAPAFLPEEMERKVVDSKNGAWPDTCTPPKIADRTPMHLTGDGKLSGVVVAVSEIAV